MDLASVLLLLAGWVAVSLVVVVPVCLLLRGAAVLEERARRSTAGTPARHVRRPVRWVRHAAGGTVVAVRRVRRTAGRR